MSNDNFVKCNINLPVDLEKNAGKKDTFQRKLYTLEYTVLTVAQSSTGEHKCTDMSVLDSYTSNFCVPLCSPKVLQNNMFKLPVIHHTGLLLVFKKIPRQKGSRVVLPRPENLINNFYILSLRVT